MLPSVWFLLSEKKQGSFYQNQVEFVLKAQKKIPADFCVPISFSRKL